ncbi:RDD family protein [Halorarum salinum]|uniref:Uncharacterized protein n=1 Tax=Halorarum salinum TaxID=2743089 RepID=A0A7D5QMF3_9EURY|nr:hypothetical protein [Halobaculum salinum]QLG63445.1 hypothetical protein HUG12_17600 [Halobaculum salinum]
MDVVVVGDDGTDCEYGASAIRNVLRVVDQLGIGIPYLVGLIVTFVADTVVVRTR